MSEQRAIKNPVVEALAHAIAGGSAGCFALGLLYPIDQGMCVVCVWLL